jgi:hypothetical protein
MHEQQGVSLLRYHWVSYEPHLDSGPGSRLCSVVFIQVWLGAEMSLGKDHHEDLLVLYTSQVIGCCFSATGGVECLLKLLQEGLWLKKTSLAYKEDAKSIPAVQEYGNALSWL